MAYQESATQVETLTFGTPGAPLAAANGASNPIFINDDRFVEITIITSGFTGTVKFACSDQVAAPNFGSAAALGNEWTNQATDDDEDGASIAGDTGIAFSASTAVRRLRVNQDTSRWLAAIVSSYSAGSIRVNVKHGTPLE